MAERTIDHLIVGGGVAAFACARELRERGADGSVVVVSRDPDPPYDRTAVSKGYLQGRTDKDGTLLAGPDWWERNGVELLTRTSAISLDAAERTVKLSNKETLRFERLLLATGANVRRLRVDGSELRGIHYVRALGNADAIRRDAEEAGHVVLVGGSYIATEVAASLTMLGKRCTLVMQEDVCLERGFGRQAGRYFQNVLEEHGIGIRPADEVAAFEGDERVSAVVTKSGERIPADVVVVGAGVTPDVMLAQRAKLDIGPRGGVLTDSSLRTSAPSILAAGDIAEYDSVLHGDRMRIEHWDVAEQQGRAAAATMLGEQAPYQVVPYFFCDLADWASLEYVGPAPRWDEEIVRGSMDEGRFTIWYLDGDRVVGALTVGRPEDLDVGRALIAERRDVGDLRATLADPDADLSALATTAGE
jgi:3-phenylpropionate/trans-cinnamate dioxygenase ferredoxin reductase subunit